MRPARYSYEQEREYYGRRWPTRAQPYTHLEPYLRSWLNTKEAFRGKRVLDIGAGECTYTRMIAQQLDPKQVIACDLFLERLLPAARENSNQRLRFVAGDCFHLPFRDGLFDIVFGSFVLHQLPELPFVVHEIRRVLARSGTYIGIEPNPMHPLHLYRHLQGKRSPNQYLLHPGHFDAFRRAGFAVKLRFFYGKLPWLRGPFLGTCMGIVAQRSAQDG